MDNLTLREYDLEVLADALDCRISYFHHAAMSIGAGDLLDCDAHFKTLLSLYEYFSKYVVKNDNSNVYKYSIECSALGQSYID